MFTPRLLVIAGVIAAFLTVLGGLYVKGRSDQAARDKAAVSASREQARVSDVTTKALDTHTTQTIILKERETRAVEAVQKAPGAADLLPPDLRAALIDGLRDIQAGPADRNRPE